VLSFFDKLQGNKMPYIYDCDSEFLRDFSTGFQKDSTFSTVPNPSK